MTALVVFDEIHVGKITPESTFVVSENAWRRGGGPSGGAAMFVPVKNPTRVMTCWWACSRWAAMMPPSRWRKASRARNTPSR